MLRQSNNIFLQNQSATTPSAGGATDASIEVAAGDWLRYAKDRDGGRKARHATVQQPQAASIAMDIDSL